MDCDLFPRLVTLHDKAMDGLFVWIISHYNVVAKLKQRAIPTISKRETANLTIPRAQLSSDCGEKERTV
jgi:hypothetical protein